MWGRPTYSRTLVPGMCWNWVNTTRYFWWRESVVGGSDGSTGKGGADVTAHPLGQPRQSTRPLSTTTTTAAAAAVDTFKVLYHTGDILLCLKKVKGKDTDSVIALFTCVRLIPQLLAIKQQIHICKKLTSLKLCVRTMWWYQWYP